MLTEAIGDILPAAVAVALSPIPIVAVVLVLAGARARSAGTAFAAGWVLGLTAVSVVVVALASGADDPDSTAATGIAWGKAAIGVLFFVMAVRQWRKRPGEGEEPEMPRWMATIDQVTAGRALVLGVALSAANPKNLALTAAAGASIGQAGLDGSATAVAIAVFVVVGSLSVAGLVVFDLVAGERAAAPLASVRTVMSDHNAVIMAVILVLMGAKLLGDALPGL